MFAMFCGLKGLTERPRRAKARARAATIVDFPTLVPVPITINAAVPHRVEVSAAGCGIRVVMPRFKGWPGIPIPESRAPSMKTRRYRMEWASFRRAGMRKA
ncbi:hypothetical protein GCM10008965_05180 [Methylorubrum aminovorans]